MTRLPAFAEAYEKQIDQEAEYGSISFHERLMLLVDAEYDSRHNNNIKRLIKNAKFSDSSMFLGNIEYLLFFGKGGPALCYTDAQLKTLVAQAFDSAKNNK